MAAMSQYLNLRPDVPKASDQVGGEVTAYSGSLRPKVLDIGKATYSNF